MPDSAVRLFQSELILSAKSYKSVGYSVIPVWGDSSPDRGKVAAIPWKQYQYRSAGENQIEEWFQQNSFKGLAIVTGTVSGIIVLDFDDPDLEQMFQSKYPHLTETRIVKSAGRGLSHYYYRLAPGMQVPSQQCKGVDLQSNGRYVIAPPTILNGKPYKIQRGGMPKLLEAADLRCIQSFLDELGVQSTSRTFVPITNEKVVEESPENCIVALPYLTPSNLSSEKLIRLYVERSKIAGRNNALFQVSLIARDAGLSMTSVISSLLPVHIEQESVCGSGITETDIERHCEGVKTIQSAYSGLPRSRADKKQTTLRYIPNELRESMLAHGMIHGLRVIEALVLKGVRGGELLTEKDLLSVLDGAVGRYSVLRALRTVIDVGNVVFGNGKKKIAEKLVIETNKKCFLFSTTVSDKNGRGRPAVQYLIPTISYLCELFGIENRAGDELEIMDVSSVRRYRSALHRELIRRRPGQYSRRWLAERLGISSRTCQRYDAVAGVVSRPNYHQQVLTWENIAYIAETEGHQGAFLQDEQGKRYPLVKSIAVALMKAGKLIRLFRQTASSFSLRKIANEMVNPFVNRLKSLEIDEKRRKIANFVKQAIKEAKPAKLAMSMVKEEKSVIQADILPAKTSPQVKTGQMVSQMNVSQDSAQIERMAQHVLDVMNRLAHNQQGELQLEKARAFVQQYGVASVEHALDTVQNRRNVRNPAGFFITLLRSEAVQRQNGLFV